MNFIIISLVGKYKINRVKNTGYLPTILVLVSPHPRAVVRSFAWNSKG
jgi:hypothetical protein